LLATLLTGGGGCGTIVLVVSYEIVAGGFGTLIAAGWLRAGGRLRDFPKLR